MLKACCECIAAGIREERDVYGAETIQLNGRSARAPSWPQANMFLLPTTLKIKDQINVTGLISPNPKSLSISLVTGWDGPNGTKPDNSNLTVQLIQFPSHDDTEEKIILGSVVEGIPETFTANLKPSDLIPDYTSSIELAININVSEDGYKLDFFINDSHVDEVLLKHKLEDFRYIKVEGDIEKVSKLEFNFS